MAGHSKWANIRHRKARQDAKRGKIFTKLIGEITVAARHGDPDPESNPRLRDAVEKARKANMKAETINKAINRGTGTDDGNQLEEIRYEGYGPNGVAVLVDCLTDNKNRTVAEVRHAFSKAGGNLGSDGSVAYLFVQQGLLSFAKEVDEEAIFEIAVEAGADDLRTNNDGSFDVLTSVEEFHQVKEAIQAANIEPEFSAITMDAANQVTLDNEAAEKVLRLLDALEDLDDVQDVYSNADIPQEVIESLS